MEDWTVTFHNGSQISGSHPNECIDVNEIWGCINESSSGVKRFEIYSDKHVVGTKQVDPDIVLHIPRYFEKVTDHFRYLDSIIVAEESEFALHHSENLDNITIEKLTLYQNARPLRCKFRNIYCSHIYKPIDIGENLKAGIVCTNFITLETTQSFLNHFSEIDHLVLHGYKLASLVEPEFTKIRVNTLEIISTSYSIVIDAALKNPHITTLILNNAIIHTGKCNFIADTSNIISIRTIVFRNVTLNSNQDLPPEVIRNQAEHDQIRFRSVKRAEL